MRSFIAIASVVIGLCGTAAADTSERSQASSSPAKLAAAAADQAVIAERDLAIARLQVAVTNDTWQRAIHAGDTKQAGYWAVQHFNAMADRRDAEVRFATHRAELQSAMR